MEGQITSKEQEELVLNNLKLVHYFVNKLDVPYRDYEDIISIGTVGLIKAAITFDSSKGLEFSTYAGKCINNEILLHLRREKKRIGDVSLEDSVYLDKKGDEVALKDVIPTTTIDFAQTCEIKEELGSYISIILNLLNKKERSIMLYRAAGIKRVKIANIVHIRRQSLSKVISRLDNTIYAFFLKGQCEKRKFDVEVMEETYRVSFYTSDIKKANEILTELSKNYTFRFGVEETENRISFFLLKEQESFSLLAKIIQEIEDLVT